MTSHRYWSTCQICARPHHSGTRCNCTPKKEEQKMGEIADMMIRDGMEHICQYCGHEHKRCECEDEFSHQDTDRREFVGNNVARPQKHKIDCPKKLVRRTNRWTGQDFIGCRSFPKCKFSRSLTEEELSVPRR